MLLERSMFTRRTIYPYTPPSSHFLLLASLFALCFIYSLSLFRTVFQIQECTTISAVIHSFILFRAVPCLPCRAGSDFVNLFLPRSYLDDSVCFRRFARDLRRAMLIHFLLSCYPFFFVRSAICLLCFDVCRSVVCMFWIMDI
jgi:hypothetical protein